MMNRTKEYINNQMQSLRRDVIASRFTSASSKTYLQYLLYFINTHIDQEETARSTIEKCFTLLDNEYWQGGISQNVYDRFITNLFDLETTIIEYHLQKKGDEEAKLNDEKMGISFQLEFSDYEKLQAEAKKDARTMASLLRLIVKKYLAEQTNHTQQKLF